MATAAASGGLGFDLSSERAALREVASTLLAIADASDDEMSREGLADQVIAIATSSERASAIAGSFMAVGTNYACSYTKGETSMARMVNSRCRLSKHRVTSLTRSGHAQGLFPSFHRLLLEGRVTLAHIDLMFGLRKRANTRQVDAAEPHLADLAARCTPEEFARKLAEWDALADVNEHYEEFLKAQTRRRVHFQRDLFGTVYLDGVLDPIEGDLFEQAVTERADALDSHDISPPQARHDALLELVLGDPDSRPRPRIEILYPCDEDAEPGPPSGQASAVPDIRTQGFDKIRYPRTTSGTLIPPPVVNRIISWGIVRTHTLTPNGNIADDKPGRRNFTSGQKRLIRLRDNHCQHTGCRRRVRHCHYDHIQPWRAGGQTLIRNGQLLCPIHHLWKHRNDVGPTTTVTRLFHDSPIPRQLE